MENKFSFCHRLKVKGDAVSLFANVLTSSVFFLLSQNGEFFPLGDVEGFDPRKASSAFAFPQLFTTQ